MAAYEYATLCGKKNQKWSTVLMQSWDEDILLNYMGGLDGVIWVYRRQWGWTDQCLRRYGETRRGTSDVDHVSRNPTAPGSQKRQGNSFITRAHRGNQP